MSDPLNITVNAALVAERLGVDPSLLMREMRGGRVFQVTERGEGEDAGRFRLTFRYRARETVIVVDAEGRPLDNS